MNSAVSARQTSPASAIVGWQDICAVTDIPRGTGMAARFQGQQVALFHTDEGIFALANRDPFSGANVLARGIIGDVDGRLVVASPVYKQHFCLRTGICLEDMTISVRSWAVAIREQRILLGERAD